MNRTFYILLCQRSKLKLGLVVFVELLREVEMIMELDNTDI